MEHYDVVIVGSGHGGATKLQLRSARTGMRDRSSWSAATAIRPTSARRCRRNTSRAKSPSNVSRSAPNSSGQTSRSICELGRNVNDVDPMAHELGLRRYADRLSQTDLGSRRRCAAHVPPGQRLCGHSLHPHAARCRGAPRRTGRGRQARGHHRRRIYRARGRGGAAQARLQGDRGGDARPRTSARRRA